MYECPIGHIFREARWVYDVIDSVNRVESCGPSEWMRLPIWFRHASRLVYGERSRLREEDDEQRRAAL